jgi:hypothetical protein
MCKELEVEEWEDRSIAELDKLVRKAADIKFYSKKKLFSADAISDTLRKFLTTEYDYLLLDKEGNLLDYRGKIRRRNVNITGDLPWED